MDIKKSIKIYRYSFFAMLSISFVLTPELSNSTIIKPLVLIICFFFFSIIIAIHSVYLKNFKYIPLYFIFIFLIIFSFGYGYKGCYKFDGCNSMLSGKILNENIDPYYFSLVNWTTLGYGDLTPKTKESKIIASIESIMGFISLGIFVTILYSFLSNKKIDFLYLERIKKKSEMEIAGEVGRQFRDIPRILDGSEKPDYQACINLVNRFALKYLLPLFFITLFAPIIALFVIPSKISVILFVIIACIISFIIANYAILSNFKLFVSLYVLFLFSIVISFGYIYHVGNGIISLDGLKCNIIDFYYFSIMTWTTIGYGDFVPANSIFRIIASVQAFLGYIYLGLFISMLNILFQDKKIILNDHKKK